jgi:hypothetical protein
VYLF